MSTPIIFNYNTFFDYYTNINNIQIDPNPPLVYYYDRYKLKSKPKSGPYIIIRGKKLYIDIVSMKDKMIDNGLLFSMIKTINGKNWDDHFHFGIVSGFSKSSRNLYKTNIIYFHKTTQDVSTCEKSRKSCYFVPNQDIRNIELIDCAETNDRKMDSYDKFPISTEDFQIIKDIIQKPFLQYFTPSHVSPITGTKTNITGGKTRRKRSHKRKTRRNKK